MGFWKMFLMIIVTAALVSAGTWYYFDQKAQSDIDALTTTKTNLQKEISDLKKESETAAKTTDEYSGWKTYTSESYNYSIKYPSTYILDSSDTKHVHFYTASAWAELQALLAKGAATEGPTPTVTASYYAALSDFDNGDPTKRSSLADLVSDSNIFSKVQTATFAGVSGYSTVENGLVESFEYLVVKNSHLYKISAPNVNGKTSLSTDAEKIINSFAFSK